MTGFTIFLSPAKQKLVQAGGKYSYTNSRTKSKYSSDPNNPQNNTCSLWEEDGQEDDLNYEKQIIANSQQAIRKIKLYRNNSKMLKKTNTSNIHRNNLVNQTRKKMLII